MAQADAEHGFVLGEELAEAPNGSLHHGRIARSVGNEQPVEFAGFFDKVVVPGDDTDFDAALGETANLVVLHAHIDCEDAQGLVRDGMKTRVGACGLVSVRGARRH